MGFTMNMVPEGGCQGSLISDVRVPKDDCQGSLKTSVRGPSRLVQDKEYVCQGSLCAV